MNAQQFAALLQKYLSRTHMSPAERGEFDAMARIVDQLAIGSLVMGKPESAVTEAKPESAVTEAKPTAAEM